MPNPVNIPSSAFNVERVRADMLANVRMPPELFQEAIDKIHAKLNAKITKFFSYQGQVVEKVDVEDHQTQLAAAEKVMGIAGVYVRERDATPSAPQVTLEMDPRTGVVRLVVGSAHTLSDLVELPVDGALELPLVVAEESTAVLTLPYVPQLGPQEEVPPQVIKVRQGNLPAAVHKALFGEPGESS